MSWLTFWQTTESDVLRIIANIKKDIAVVESDINSALKWIADNAGTITSDIEAVLGVVQAVGIANPAVEAAVTAANSAVSALNAYAQAYQNGRGTPKAVVAGYSAFKQAQAAAATAASAVVMAPASVAPVPPSAPAAA
jgi:hypothetical protein